MKTTFTSEDTKNLIEQIFNGNLRQSLATGVEYVNPNSETILLIDAETQEQTSVDLAKHLNIKFYDWKERIVNKGETYFDDNSQYSVFDKWVESLNISTNESYALVEKTDEEVVASQDIDSATITARVTFLIQANKIKNLDYYVTKLRNAYLGKIEDIQNSYGEIRKSFLTIGTLIYDQEPFMSQLGETMVVSFNFRLSYLNDAAAYSDIKVEISLDGDTEPNEEKTTGYLEMPITKATYQNIFTVDSVPTNARPDLTGVIATTLSMAKTLTFYDYNKPLAKRLDHIFWSLSAYKIDTVLTTAREINIPVYLRITTADHVYVYRDVIERMEKTMTNNDFNICSLSLRNWGKVE